METDSYVWVSDVEEEDCTVVDDRMWGASVVIHGDGCIGLKVSGKNSGIEYWTTDIKLSDITTKQ